MLKRIKVLLVEDDKEVADFEKSALEKYESINFEITHTTSLKNSLKLIGKKFFDVILLDLILPNGEGLEVFENIHNKCKQIPIVIISGYEEHALGAVRAGAQDYLIKPVSMNKLVTSIKYSIARKKIESECVDEYKMLLNIFDNMEEMIYVSDPETHKILYMNEPLKQTFGCSIGEKCYTTFAGQDFPCVDCHNDMIFGQNFGKNYTYDIKAGTNGKWYRSTIRSFKWPDGRILRYTISIDISKEKEKEEKLSRFLEAKLDEWNSRIKKSKIHQQSQIQRLEEFTNIMVNGDLNGAV